MRKFLELRASSVSSIPKIPRRGTWEEGEFAFRMKKDTTPGFICQRGLCLLKPENSVYQYL